MSERVAIGFRRRLAGVLAVVFAASAVNGLSRGSGDRTSLLVGLVILAGAALTCAAFALRRGPVLVLDSAGVLDVRRDRRVSWAQVQDAHVAVRHAAFDRCHELVLTVHAEPALRLPLDQLARGWAEVAQLVERGLGRDVDVRTEGSAAGARA